MKARSSKKNKKQDPIVAELEAFIKQQREQLEAAAEKRRIERREKYLRSYLAKSNADFRIIRDDLVEHSRLTRRPVQKQKTTIDGSNHGE